MVTYSPYAKHLGPGDHPSGSPQTVHGGGGGGDELRTFFGRPPHSEVSPTQLLNDFADDPDAEWVVPGSRYYQRYYVKDELNIWVEHEVGDTLMHSRAFTRDGEHWNKWSVFGIPDSGSGRVTDQVRPVAELAQQMGIDPRDLGLEAPPPPVDTSDWLDPRTRESIERTLTRNESQLESLYHDLDTEKELAGVYSGSLDPVQTDDVIQVQNRIRELEAETTRLRVLQNNPPLPGMDPPLPERLPGEKKPITSATGKVAATFEDPYSLSDRAHETGSTVSDWTPEDIFEGTVELSDGSRYTAQLEDSGGGYGTTSAWGAIYSEDGTRVGKFERNLNDDGSVYNASFSIDPEYRGQGIGTLFLAHWEEELAAAGFEQMRVQTVDIGNYAWAVSGYSWDSGAEGYFDFMSDMISDDEEYSEEGESDLIDTWGEGPVEELRSMVEEIREGSYYPEPYEIAAIGANSPRPQSGPYGQEEHLGKRIMLDGPGWYGVKWLDQYNFQKALSYSILYNEWARRDPAAIENDAPEWWAAVRQLLGKDSEPVEKIYSPYAKHNAPIHPGTGTGQEVHGGGKGARDLDKLSANLAAADEVGVRFKYSGDTNLTSNHKSIFELSARAAVGRFHRLYPNSGIAGPGVNFKVIDGIEMTAFAGEGTGAYVNRIEPSIIVVNEDLITGEGGAEFKAVIDTSFMDVNRASIGPEVYKANDRQWDRMVEATLFHEVVHSAEGATDPLEARPDTFPAYNSLWFAGKYGTTDWNWENDPDLPSRYAAGSRQEYFAEALTDYAFFGEASRGHSRLTHELYSEYLDEVGDWL